MSKLLDVGTEERAARICDRLHEIFAELNPHVWSVSSLESSRASSEPNSREVRTDSQGSRRNHLLVAARSKQF